VKALLCKEFGSLETLAVEDVPAPVAGPGQVLISVQAASVNFPDTLIVQGKYQAKPDLPFIPGAELAGVVKACGEGVTHLQPGMPVLALSMRGAFAEEVAVDAPMVLPLPPGMEPTVAAAVPMTYGTAYHALSDRGQLEAGESLLVLGAGGGVGLAAVDLGKLMGATVIAAASSDDKLNAASSRGADHIINYSTEDLRARLKEIVHDAGVDVVCDPVGGPWTELALRSTAWRGRYLVIGFAAGDIPRIGLNLPLLKGNSILGVFWGEFMRREPGRFMSQLIQLLEWVADGKLSPLVDTMFPLSEAVGALQAIAERRVTGKVIIVP
jgi:NADPH2:quinone reductase